jgi:hypothetical protein
MIRRSLRSRRRGNQSIPKSAKIGATRYSKTSNAFAFRAYVLTTGSGIVDALVRAKERGVDVRLIADKATLCQRETGIEPLAAAGTSRFGEIGARLPSWTASIAVVAVGLASGLLVVSTNFIGRFLRCLIPSRAEMLQPKAEQPKEKQITISAWRG